MKEKNTSFKEILSIPTYRKLLFSNAINRFGDSIDAIAFTWLIYQITHSAAWSAIVFGLNMLPNVIVQPFAGAIVEKMNKKKVVIFTHLMRAAVIAAFALLNRFELVNAPIMAVATLLITTIESFNLPAASAFTVQTVRKEHVTAGVSLDKMLSGAASLAGTGVAGIIISSLGLPVAMIIDVLTFIIATLFIASMNIKCSGTADQKNESADVTVRTDLLSLFREGIKYVIGSPVVRNFCLLCIALNLMLVPINALQAPIISEIFMMGSELLSIAGVFGSVGSIVGASIIPVLSKRLSPLKITCIGIGALSIGIAGITLGNVFAGNRVACYVIASLCFFTILMAASLLGGIIGIQFMKSVDPAYMARASAVFNSSSTAAMPIGSLFVSMAVSHVSTSVMIILSSVFATIVLLATMITKPALEKKEGEPNAT